MTYTIDGNTGTWEIVCGLEVHAQVTLERQAVLGRVGGLWRRAQQPGEPGRCRDAGDAAGR
jgi:hypothetical protein